MQSLDQRISTVRGLLADNEVELEYFEENLKLVQQFLDEHTFKEGALCVFACWANDYREAFELEKEVPDLLWVDSSPYIRPIAELQDEYENFVVIAADNTETQVFFVTSATAEQEGRVKGDIKNQVKVGGWSQKRYERRRDDALMHYAKDVADEVQALGERESFDRILLLGSEEAMREIEQALPQTLAEKVAGKEAIDLHDEDALWDEAFSMYFEEERASEESLWEQIKSEYMRDGQAVVGAEEVLRAAAVGRVEKMIVTRDAKIAGMRCRTCENLSAKVSETCPVCGSGDVFKVDLINELVELLAASGAETEFADPIEGLTSVGDVAARLRY